MVDSVAELLEEVEKWSAPKRFKDFFSKEREDTLSRSDHTFRYFAVSYEKAFELLAEWALDRWGVGGVLHPPILYLARHSIELHLKLAIDEYVEYTGRSVEASGQQLVPLWNELKRQFELAGMPDLDEWGRHCERLIAHIHDIDPDGESFRYPTHLGDKTFNSAHIELEGLKKAHRNIVLYCEASLNLLGERNPYY